MMESTADVNAPDMAQNTSSAASTVSDGEDGFYMVEADSESVRAAQEGDQEDARAEDDDVDVDGDEGESAKVQPETMVETDETEHLEDDEQGESRRSEKAGSDEDESAILDQDLEADLEGGDGELAEAATQVDADLGASAERRGGEEDSLSMPHTEDFFFRTDEASSLVDDEASAALKQVVAMVAQLAQLTGEASADQAAAAAANCADDKKDLLACLRDLASMRHVVEAVQAFASLPAVCDVIVEAAESNSLERGLTSNMADLFAGLADLTYRAPELAAVAPMAFAKLVDAVRAREHPVAPAAAAEPPAKAQTDAAVQAQEQRPKGVVHRHILCDGCDTPDKQAASAANGHRQNGCIVGVRWKSAITEDFDLCTTCESTGDFEEQHGPFLKITEPKKAPRELVVVLREDGSCGGGTGASSNPRCRRGRRRHNNWLNAARRRTQEQQQQQQQQQQQKEAAKEPESSMKLVCPAKSHPLQRFCASIGFTCDICEKSPSFGQAMLGCRQCNWDICMVCADVQYAHSLAMEGLAGAQKEDSKADAQPEAVPQDQPKEKIVPQEESAPQTAPPVMAPTPPPAVRPLGKFVADVSVPDGTVLPAGQPFTKTWRIANPSADQAWPSDVRLVCVGGERMEGPEEVAVVSLPKQSAADLSVDLVAPAEGGRFVGYWRLMSDGQRFGHRLWIDITVVRKWDEQLRALAEMGFAADKDLLQLLDEEDGNLENVIPRLCC